MPTYEYDCTECGHTFEQFQRITAAPLEVCPQCGGKVQRRINGGAGLIFKGSGFYLTDYKRAPAGSSKSGSETAKKDGDATAKKEGSDAAQKAASEKGTSEKPEKKEKSTTE